MTVTPDRQPAADGRGRAEIGLGRKEVRDLLAAYEEHQRATG